jgi:hypothetical protein
MKVLVIISHYFKSEVNGIYSSTNASLREIRKQTLEKVLLFWRSHYDENSIINIDKKKLVINRSCVDQLDLVLLIHEDNHLIDDNIIKTYGLKIIKVKTDNPRMIPFAAQKVMAELSNSYEWFIYSEDDLAIHDSLLFHKLTLFQNKFGFTRLLQPNRFEINKSALRFKTYVDGDLKDGFIKPFLEKINEQSNTLTLKDQGDFDINFLRALNPHSGFFALTAEQLKHWMAQKHFMDLDCSFVSPLESGATLGILKTFSIYKSTVPNLGYFEIEHLDKKFSNMKLDVLLS